MFVCHVVPICVSIVIRYRESKGPQCGGGTIRGRIGRNGSCLQGTRCGVVVELGEKKEGPWNLRNRIFRRRKFLLQSSN